MKIKRPVRDQTFTVTCTMQEKKALIKKAQENGRTICGYVRWLILREIENDDRA